MCGHESAALRFPTAGHASASRSQLVCPGTLGANTTQGFSQSVIEYTRNSKAGLGTPGRQGMQLMVILAQGLRSSLEETP